MRSKSSTVKCPYCEILSRMECMTEWDYGRNKGHAVIYKCINCGEPVFIDWSSKRGYSVYPKQKLPLIDKAIPASVAADYKEALVCYSDYAPKATVIMCRRALQTSTIENGARGDNLISQIDDLYNQGIITPVLRDLAHEIRLAGNLGAHPDKDGLEDIIIDDAEQILKFAKAYFEYVYIMPKQVAEYRQKKKST